MLNAAVANALDNIEYFIEPFFGLHVPKKCPGVPGDVLNPKETWSDKNAYDEKAKDLAGQFVKNFERYKGTDDQKITAAGPKTS